MRCAQPILGIAVKQQRLLKGMTLQDVADLAGIRKGQISRIEHGRDVQLTTINKLLPALGLEASLTIK